MTVGANVAPSVGSSSAASRGSTARTRATAPSRIGRVLAERLEERARLVRHVVGDAGGADPLDGGQQAQQRVVGQRRNGRVAGAAAGAQREAERALLGAADAVEAAVAVAA